MEIQSKIKNFLGLKSRYDFRVVYLRYAKTAGVFLDRYFHEYYQGQIVTVLHTKPYKKEICLQDLARKFDQYFKFTVVRNPWEWQVSFYTHFCQSWQNPNRDLFRMEFPTFNDWLTKRKLHTLEKYAGNFCWESEPFHQICYYNNVYLPDFIIKLQSLESDIVTMFKLSGLTIAKSISDFKKENNKKNHIASREDIAQNVINATEHKHYSFYYTDELKDLIYENNRELIDKFNFEFEDRR